MYVYIHILYNTNSPDNAFEIKSDYSLETYPLGRVLNLSGFQSYIQVC